MALGITSLSLNHVIAGVGEPVTVQVRLIGWPARPVVGRGGSVIIGRDLTITVL